MQFVLDDEVGRAQRADGLQLGAGQVAAALMIGVAHLRRRVAMTLAVRIHLAEKHGGPTVPRHLRELVDRADEQRGQAAVDFLIHS